MLLVLIPSPSPCMCDLRRIADRLRRRGLGRLGELDWLCAAADDALRAGEECSARYVRLVTPRRGAALVAWTTRRSWDGAGRIAEVREAPPRLCPATRPQFVCRSCRR